MFIFHRIFIFVFLLSVVITGACFTLCQSLARKTGIADDAAPKIYDNVNNRLLTVTTILSPPYCQLKDSVEKLNGNDRYNGYAVDLIREISVILGFNYTISIAPDGRYGSVDEKTGKWNGMIGELMEGRADMAIADLTITRERERVVDFSFPFMNVGVSILYLKPSIEPPSLFSFLSPFSTDVWIGIAIAFLVVSVVLYLLSRFTQDKETSEKKFDQGETPFTLLNCMWFTIASLMMQRCVFLPRTTSTRMVAVLWWIFALIMVSSYTANLAAFLTVESAVTPIRSIEDLPSQSRIKYGAMNDGSTSAFLKNSPQNSTYQRTWKNMESSEPSVFTDSNADGIERVKAGNGDYAFFMESAAIEYAVERNCELTQIGGLLNSKAYGIALENNSPYRSVINEAILKLQELGRLDYLKRRWWIKFCSVRMDDSSPVSELYMHNVIGVFYVLTIGLVVACIIAAGEFFWKYRRARTNGQLEIQQN